MNTGILNIEKQKYIEEVGLTFEQFGMTRMAGRVLGYLMICDQDAASFNTICEAIQASKGSASGSLKQLLQIGFIKAVSLPGDRKTYYQINKMPWTDFLTSKLDLYDLFAENLEKGRSLKTREDEVSEWLLEASVFYRWIGGKVHDIIDEWEREKKQIMRDELTKT
ncbi:MAG: hypothetical protein WD097_06260 [Balneolales bacterium]